MCNKKLVKFCFSLFLLSVFILPTKTISAQGNIYGLVSNSDNSTPADGELSFFGYLENSDEEIKIESCIGAGYDTGNWYDNLPNYLTVTVEDQFNYHFYNIVNGENYYLLGTIDSGGFQREDIKLSSSGLPEKPGGHTGKAVSGPAIEIDWTAVAGLTYHIYSRNASSNGSFFRIDDPSGLLSNPGVASGPYLDYLLDGFSSYDYLIIAENSSGDLSPHSDILSLSSFSFICGDVDNDGFIGILDIVYFIEFKYKEGPAPDYPESADVDSNGIFSILDVIALINFKYKEGPALNCVSP